MNQRRLWTVVPDPPGAFLEVLLAHKLCENARRSLGAENFLHFYARALYSALQPELRGAEVIHLPNPRAKQHPLAAAATAKMGPKLLRARSSEGIGQWLQSAPERARCCCPMAVGGTRLRSKGRAMLARLQLQKTPESQSAWLISANRDMLDEPGQAESLTCPRKRRHSAPSNGD